MMDELVSLGNEPILVVALDHDVQNRAFKAVHQDLGGLPLDSDGTGFAHAIRNDPLPIAASTLVNGRFTNRAKQNLPVSKFGRQTSLPDSPTRCSRRRRPCCNRNRLPRQPYDNRNTTCQIWANRVLTSYLIRFKRNRLCWSEGRSDQTRFGAVFGFGSSMSACSFMNSMIPEIRINIILALHTSRGERRRSSVWLETFRNPSAE
ncbi:hypothetical protein V1507DRAFT_449907 [Lipomyces tetrasporus]